MLSSEVVASSPTGIDLVLHILSSVKLFIAKKMQLLTVIFCTVILQYRLFIKI